MSENGEIYTAGKNFTLLPAVTSWTNLTLDKKFAFVEVDGETVPEVDKKRTVLYWSTIFVQSGDVLFICTVTSE